MRRLILLSLVAIATARYVEFGREKRDVEQHDWLTEEQRAELKALKESADGAALKKRTMELFELLPADEKAKWGGKYKEMCVAWIKEVATEEEHENFKKWKTEGKMDEIKSQYAKQKARLSEHKRKDVELWESECWELWKDEFPAASRGRRSVMDLAKEKLSFLGEEKLAELKALKESGASDDVIRDKVVTWTIAHWKSKDSTTSTADFLKSCYGWIKDVTQTEEYEAFEKLHHTDHEACRVKVREFLARLPVEKQAVVEKSLPLCDAIWYKQHQEEHGAHAGHDGHDHHAHKHHVRRHLNTMHIEKFLTWLTKEQKDELNAMEAQNKSYDKITAKLIAFYNGLEKEKKGEIHADLKDKCSDWVFDKTTESEQYELQELVQNGDKDGLLEYLKTPYSRLTEEEKHVVDHTKNFCIEIYTTQPERKRRDHHGDHHEEYKEYFSWLTPEQGAEVKALKDAGNQEGVYTKMEEYYAGLTGDKKTEATEKLKGACKHFFNKAFGEDAVAEIKMMKESGSSMDDIGKKVEEFIGKITDEKKKAVAARASGNCKKIFSASRKRRDHHHDEEFAAYKEYFTWLSPEQAAEIKTLKEAGDKDAIDKKIHEYFDLLVGDKKTEAGEKLKGACKHFFKDVFGEAAVEEIKMMKESGSSVDAIADKVTELIEKITDEKKKTAATRASGNCKKLFAAARKRRDHHGDHHEEYKEYFSWLTPEQGAEVKALRDAGNQEGVYTKMEEYYAGLTGDKKTEATEKLKGGCKHFFNKAFGEDAVAEIKAMKESGSSMDDIGKKVEEFIGKITDEKKKAVATRASANCKKIFSASRKRRDHHHGEEFAAYKEYFTWLTPEQAAEVKKLNEAGDQDAANKKVHEYFGALEGDKKAEAKEKLKAGCKHFFKDVFGEAAVEEIKMMKESGSSMDDIGKKVEEFLGKITDEKKKATATRASGNCKKLYGASRRRRDQHSVEEHFKEFLPWLSEEQQKELKALKESGKDIGDKIMEFFDAVSADKKDEARTKLQAGCRHFLSHLIGDAASAELKALKESGATAADMTTKLEEIIGKMTEGEDRRKATLMSKNCKKIYGVASRKRRHEHTLEESFADFLPWITEEQKMELKNMKEAGAEDKIGEKVVEYFENVDADKKDEARTKLQAGCRHYLTHLLGDAVAAEMKAMHEAGSSATDISKKLDEIISKLDDAQKKAKATIISKNCKKVYGVVSRKRRHEHTLEEGLSEFLPWITEEQKMELKNMKEAGAKDKIGEKVMEYYESVDASKKDEARTKLQAGCRHYLTHLLGDSVSGEMKAMHESGTSPAEMAKKLDEIISNMDDAEKKAKATVLSKQCRKVYGVDARKRRNTYGEYDERYHQYYNWLEEEQKEELAELQDSGEDSALLDKVSQYFKDLSDAKKEEARGQLKMGCRMRMRDLLGEQRSEEISKMKNQGATKGEMLDKVAQFVEEMEEGAEKEKARRSYKHCAKILSRQRRAEDPNKSLADYTKWLTADQRQELNAIIRSESVSSDDIYSKLFEFVETLEGEEKKEATHQMRGACRLFRAQFLGPAQSEKLTVMRQTGKKWTDIEHTLDGMIAAIEDANKRRKAQAAMNACKILYKAHIN